MGSDEAEIRSQDMGAQAVGDSLGNVLQKKETVPAKTRLKALQNMMAAYDGTKCVGASLLAKTE